MNIILCLDNQNGMLFNHRRQSRDRAVIADIVKSMENTSHAKLWIAEYSAPLFAEVKEAVDIVADNDLLDYAADEDDCFIENLPLQAHEAAIRSVTVYRWNRHYPADMRLDIALEGWKLVSCIDFAGHSHNRITKETYQK